jgi:hypothetical protein
MKRFERIATANRITGSWPEGERKRAARTERTKGLPGSDNEKVSCIILIKNCFDKRKY